MTNANTCVGGSSGPLIVLQDAAVPLWQGASDFDNSLMGGGYIETDYDVICGDGQPPEGVFVLNRHGRGMLVLWQSAYGAALLSPKPLALSADTIVLTFCIHSDDFPAIMLPHIVARVQRGQPEHLMSLGIEDTMLGLQVGADSAEPSYTYNFVDIPVSPGLWQCEVYLVEHDSLVDEVVVISPVSPNWDFPRGSV